MKTQTIVAAGAASLMTVLGAHNAHASCFDQSQVTGWMVGRVIALGGAPGSPTPGPGYSLTSETGGTGFMQTFTNGEMWADACESSITGGWMPAGDILDHYLALGGASGILRYPTSDWMDTPTGDGTMTTFEATSGGAGTDGAIFRSSSSGAREMHAALYAKYEDYGSTGSGLGYPTSDVESCDSSTCGTGGHMNTMQNGFMADVSGHGWGLLTIGHSSAKLSYTADLNAFGAEITLIGSGFHSGESVTLNLLTWGGRTARATVNADSSGNFSKDMGDFDSFDNGLGGSGAWSGHTIMTWEAVGATTSGSWLAGTPLD